MLGIFTFTPHPCYFAADYRLLQMTSSSHDWIPILLFIATNLDTCASPHIIIICHFPSQGTTAFLKTYGAGTMAYTWNAFLAWRHGAPIPGNLMRPVDAESDKRVLPATILNTLFRIHPPSKYDRHPVKVGTFTCLFCDHENVNHRTGG
jgi:hypothetical protein